MPDREKVIKDLEEYRDREFVKEGITVFDNDPRYRKLIIGNALALLKDYDTQLQYRDDHIAEYEKEIKRLEDLLKAREEIIKQYHKTDTFLAIHG